MTLAHEERTTGSLEKKADRVSIINLSIGEWWKSGRKFPGYS